MFILYNLLLTLTAPLWVPWMLWRTARRAEKPNWKERFGDLALTPRKDRKRVWFHAVSVGEVVASLPILRETRALLPDHEIVLSVTTSSGHRTARDQAMDLVDHLIYFPLDVARFQLAAMQRVQPSVVAILETELWLNFLWAAKTFEAKTLLVNGRISDRSFRRSRLVAFFYRALLRDVDACLMQSPQDADRIRALGGQNVEVLGNAKFDQAADALDADPADVRRRLGLEEGLFTIVVGSTRGEDEEALVVAAIQRLGLEHLQVVHAPRHLERADALAQRVQEAFGSVARRSHEERGRYVILDTYGELAGAYAAADVAVVGGGFGEYGGQNLLQPLAHGIPVAHGPHMFNFRDAAQAAAETGATTVCDTAEALADTLRAWRDDPAVRERMGQAAAQFVEATRGASRRYAEAIARAAAGAPVS